MEDNDKRKDYFFFINTTEKTVKLYKEIDNSLKIKDGFWVCATHFPEEYEYWIDEEKLW